MQSLFTWLFPPISDFVPSSSHAHHVAIPKFSKAFGQPAIVYAVKGTRHCRWIGERTAYRVWYCYAEPYTTPVGRVAYRPKANCTAQWPVVYDTPSHASALHRYIRSLNEHGVPN